MTAESLPMMAGETIIALPFILAVGEVVRRKVINRDKTCQDVSGTSHVGGLEVAHIDHTKPCGEGSDCHQCTDYSCSYQSPDNLTTLCTKHHLLNHIQNEGENGLTVPQNNWAIAMIGNRLSKIFLKK